MTDKSLYGIILRSKTAEVSLSYFIGDDIFSIKNWISEFEHMGVLFKWNNLQKLVYGKRMLKESMRQFIRERDHILECSQTSPEEFKVEITVQ